MIAGAVSPVLAVFLLSVADNKPWPVALYMIGMSVVTIVATWMAPETRRGNKRRKTGQTNPSGSDTDMLVTSGSVRS